MADLGLGQISEIASSIGGSFLNLFIILFVVLFAIGLGFLAYILYARWKRYEQFSVVIWGRDAYNQITQIRDKAGIFVDRKTNNKRFYIKGARVGLSPDKIQYVVNNKGHKTVYLWRGGLKNFFYIKPELLLNKAGVNELKFTVGEEDVNWAINSFEEQLKRFDLTTLLQYLPYIISAIVFVVIMIVFIYFFKNFDVLKDVAAHLEEAARQIAMAKAGNYTAVIPA